MKYKVLHHDNAHNCTMSISGHMHPLFFPPSQLLQNPYKDTPKHTHEINTKDTWVCKTDPHANGYIINRWWHWIICCSMVCFVLI